ncbi:hypothetical protein HCN44_007367 [Aphidius gifuensis]|uniref:DNA-directed RNA polymerase III subunit RPC9 n=1 Tax=Aphidius gifuensis TaxID=684658 RepID=A0A835CM94_APHGI|nr:DNA-directed RNA polymerase III subunit RPC9 [Aphidius gifuensis]KAF7989057.1 hypothetical protein HCN44_007367 [Aphidius gifuensis]
MEVVNEKSAYLSNFEVLNLLKGIKENKSKKKNLSELATVTYETVRYLEGTPCENQNPEKIKAFMSQVEKFKLTKCEKLMIVNTVPKSLIEIQCIVEDSEDRLSEEEVNNLLDVIKNTLDETPELPEESSTEK